MDTNHRSNPRAWKRISDFLHVLDKIQDDLKPKDAETLAYISGLIGPEMARDFLLHRTCTSVARLSAADILGSYGATHRHIVQEMISAKRLSELGYLVETTADHLEDVDLCHAALHDAVARENLALFLNDLPTDLRAQIHNRIPALKVAL